MKKLTIMTIGFLSAASFGHHMENINGRIAIAPEKVSTFTAIPSEELEEFCGRASSYIENFHHSLEQNNCLEDMDSSGTCLSIKRIYKRLASAPGAIGTDLEAKLTMGLHAPVFEELDISKIANELGKDQDQVINATSLTMKSLREINSVFSNPGNFKMAMQVVGITPGMSMEGGKVIFNDRLSACAFETKELSISGTIEVEGQVIDSIPKSATDFLLKLKGSLKEAYLNHEELSDPEVDSHLRGFELMGLGLDLAHLEKELKESRVLAKFQKMKPFGFMDSWWKHFYRTDPQRGVVKFRDLSTEKIKELYPTQVYKIHSNAKFELTKGKF